MRVMLLLAAMLMAGCAAKKKLPGFGAPYGVDTTTAPSIVGDELVVTLGYGGCGHTAQVTLHHRFVDGGAVLWVRKDSRAEPCDMHVQSTHRLTLAPDVLAAERITLLTPGGVELVLRAVSRAP